MFVNVMGGDPYYNVSVNGNNEYLDGKLFAATKMLSAVEVRASNIESFDNLEKNSVDFYASVRSVYTQDRENKIKNIQRGNLEVIYKEDQDWEEIDTK
jgi:phospholipid-binding lipoprotein MlaA